ncbi:MAG: site-specific integrase [Pseudonocardia sp.]|uniref:tyrosine-type recombinase/integrase n=1 Tax=Pseudonocardia sp. TaxID=60912 RepID=UPI001AC6E5B5|nr:site-specific integrase [Pseudonocardia sp.]MBN9101469.1 site-specific integrase [Pseudonocardia sp.]
MPARKRPNGEGTIYLRADGRYEGAAVVPVIGGGRRRIRVYAATRAEARDKLDQLLDDARQSIPRSIHKQTVSAYLTYWLEHVVKPELRATTYNGYEIMVRRHLIPALGRKYLTDLSPADVRRMLAELREKETIGHGGGPRKLSPRMVQFAHAVLRNALSNAVREELVGRNVAKMVRTTTPDYDVGAGLDPIAARALLDTIRDDRLYPLYLCAVVLGMRRGELLGLTWSAVNLDGAVLVVRQTLNWVNGRRHIQPPKTRASRRTIPLPLVVVDALRDHQKRQAEESIAAGDRWAESGFVFTTRHGEPMSPFTLTKYWHDVRAAAGLDTLRFHDLRHTAVSLLLALGVPPHVVKEIAGHSDIKVTMTVYAHGHLDEKAAALAQLGAAVATDRPPEGRKP